jgi:hypothetical protein
VIERTDAVEGDGWVGDPPFDGPGDGAGWTPEELAAWCCPEEIELAEAEAGRRRGRQRRMAVVGVGLLLVAAASTVSAAVVGSGAHLPRSRATIAVLNQEACRLSPSTGPAPRHLAPRAVQHRRCGVPLVHVVP